MHVLIVLVLLYRIVVCHVIHLRLLPCLYDFWRWWGLSAIQVFGAGIVVEPWVIGGFVWGQDFVGEETQVMLAVVCEAGVVPSLAYVLCDFLDLLSGFVCPADEAHVVPVVFGIIFLNVGGLPAFVVERAGRDVNVEL